MIVMVAQFIANNLFSNGSADTMFLGFLVSLVRTRNCCRDSAVQLDQYGNRFDVWLDGLKAGTRAIHPVGYLH